MSKKTKLEKLDSHVHNTYKKKLTDLKEANEKAAYDKREREFQKSLLKFQKSRITKDSRGGESSDWDQSNSHAAEALSAATTAFNAEWKNAYLGLVSIMGELNKAMNNTVTEGSMHLMHQLPALGIPTLKDTIASIIGDDPEYVIPAFMHEASINEKMELEASLTENKSKADTGFDDHFRAVIVEWLAEHGYTPDPGNPKGFIGKDNKPLTNAGFQKLKQEENLYSYLNESNLSFHERPSMKM
jgi:hypothetical protein